MAGGGRSPRFPCRAALPRHAAAIMFAAVIAVAGERGKREGCETVLEPGSPAYEASRWDNNRRIRRSPAKIFIALSDDDVEDALRSAREDGSRRVAVRSGGHSYLGNSLGNSSRDYVVDVSGMDSIEVDVQRKQVTVGPGARLRPIAKALATEGLVVPLGSCATVGIAGFVLGGGYGLFSRQLGLTADNLLSADVILGNGTRLTASAEHSPSLFWALRGGGGGALGSRCPHDTSGVSYSNHWLVAASFPVDIFSPRPRPVAAVGATCPRLCDSLSPPHKIR